MVHCARSKDLGCKAEHASDKFSAIRAAGAGWFRSRQDEQEFCPEHVPDWVPAWRERQQQSKRKVRSAFERSPVAAACAEGDFAENLEIPDDERAAAELLRALRIRAHDHAYKTGHTVNVTTSQVISFEAYYEEAVRA